MMLLNLSNHPVENWSTAQKETAMAAYGTVLDLPFPDVPANYTADQVLQLVEQYEQKIRTIDPKAVHLMGETTFVYALVNRLVAIGYPCIASTTKRQVRTLADGSKNSMFQFVKFRRYE